MFSKKKISNVFIYISGPKDPRTRRGESSNNDEAVIGADHPLNEGEPRQDTEGN